mmetsp:Transcript_71010/g.160713  ORF Transcript_71010/g.160713 Transcript_71010/m.160713 type:complete len:232 (-) Transcript_71010:41-736(-)
MDRLVGRSLAFITILSVALSSGRGSSSLPASYHQAVSLFERAQDLHEIAKASSAAGDYHSAITAYEGTLQLMAGWSGQLAEASAGWKAATRFRLGACQLDWGGGLIGAGLSNMSAAMKEQPSQFDASSERLLEAAKTLALMQSTPMAFQPSQCSIDDKDAGNCPTPSPEMGPQPSPLVWVFDDVLAPLDTRASSNGLGHKEEVLRGLLESSAASAYEALSAQPPPEFSSFW